MILDKFDEIKQGECCPKCGHSKLYPLSDGRSECANCHHRFSPDKVRDDCYILEYFARERSALRASKFLEFSFNKVYHAYMKLRQEILEYSDKENIPRRTPIFEVRKIPRDKKLTGFKAFVKERLKRLPRISKKHLPLYQREFEFRYHYRKKKILPILIKIHFGSAFNQ